MPGPEPRTRGLSAEDIALFRRLMQGVRPLRASNRAVLAAAGPAKPRWPAPRHHAGKPPPTAPGPPLSDVFTAAGLEQGHTHFLAAGHSPQILKSLKKRRWPVSATLDLHGATLDEARGRIDEFIEYGREHQMRCIRIIHGKGLGSRNSQPVLKQAVRRWLSQLAFVQAFIECDDQDGGSGAVLVLIKKRQA